MSNIIYSVQVNPPADEEDDNSLLINTNDKIAEKLNAAKAEYERKQEEKRRKEREELMNQPALDEEGNPVLDEEGNPVMLGQLMPEDADTETENLRDPHELIAEAEANAADILERANLQAESILEDANQKAEAMRGHIEDEAKRDGYNAGLAQAGDEMNAQRKAMEEEMFNLRADFEKHKENMEAELVGTIADVMSEIFKVKFSDDQEMMMHIVENALMHAESSKQFLVKVNEENAKAINNQKEELQQKVGENVEIDIVTDPVLNQSDCIIETDGGIFDCSLDTQLKNLTKAIKMLSLA